MPVGRDTHRDGSPRIDRSGSGLQRSQGFPSSWRSPDADDLGDLVDPQNDTYEEEGTHGQRGEMVGRAIGTFAGKRVGLGKAGGAAGAKLGSAAEEKLKDPEFQENVKEKVGAAAESATEIAGKALGVAKDKLKGKGGAGLASPASDGVGTPEGDDPLA